MTALLQEYWNIIDHLSLTGKDHIKSRKVRQALKRRLAEIVNQL